MVRIRAMMFVVPLAAAFFGAPSCAVIHQGEVGLKRVWGELEQTPLQPGLYSVEYVSTDIIRVPIRTTTKTVDFVLPSKEGLNVNARMSILYRILPERAADVIGQIGEDYEETLVAAVFRSQAADVSARFFAKDMYSAERRTIEMEIAQSMAQLLEARGFVVEEVLMKSISLPPGLTASIEQKLQAEQQAEQMRFEIEREKLEAERKRIEAEGISEAQLIISNGLTEQVLRLREVEAIRDLARSPNSKIVFVRGEAPMVLDQTPGK